MLRCPLLALLAGMLVAACGDPPTAAPPITPPAPTVNSIVVIGVGSPGTPGATQQLTATASLSDNTTQNVTSLATWASSTPAVATVSATGLVAAVGPGQTDVTATYQGKSGAFRITVAAVPTRLAFTVEPSTTLAGAVITPAVQVTAQDAVGNIATIFTGPVTIAISTNPSGGAVAGTTTALAVNGVATFSNLNITASGTGYTLTAAVTGLASATSVAFNVTPGAASALAFTVQPTNTNPGAAVTPAVRVVAKDIWGNVAASFAGSVTVAIGANPGGGTLSGTTTVAAVAGAATFSGLSIGTNGSGYTLSASASGLNPATSNAFSVAPGIATRLAFSVQPSNAPNATAITPAVQVTALNGSGGTATAFVGTVALALGTNPSGATLSGSTTIATVNGVASFADLRIDKPGSGYALTASVPGLTGATSAAFNVACASDCWSTAAPMPTARGGLGIGVVGGVLYAVGGAQLGATVATVEAYDPATNTWTSKAPLPTPRSYPGVGAAGGVLYAVGGLNASGPTGTVEAYDPATNTWTAKAPLPTPRVYLSVGVVNGILYAVGGVTTAGQLSGAVEAYDPATDTWTAKAAMPTARIVLGVGIASGSLYAVGGFTGSYLAIVEAYDPAANTWSTKAPLPTPRGGLGVAAVNNIVYALGGVNTGSTALGTVEAYNPANNSWTTKAPMPTARVDLGVGVVNGILYAAGGRPTPSTVTAVTEAYKP